MVGGRRKGRGRGRGKGREEGDDRTNPKPAATALFFETYQVISVLIYKDECLYVCYLSINSAPLYTVYAHI